MEATSSAELLKSILDAAQGDPLILAALVVNFLVGVGLGYLSIKIAKYMVAAVGLIAASLAFNVWVYGRSPEELTPLSRLAGEALEEVKLLLVEAAKVLGLMTLSPLTIGFVMGLVVGAVKK